MSTSASLVVGADGSTTKFGSSRGVTSQADHSDFLARRRNVDAIIIGGNTARSEPYEKTPVPLVIVSRRTTHPVPKNPQAHLWNTSPAQAINRARAEFGDRVLVEGGVSMLTELLAMNLIDDFFLTVTQVKDGEKPIDWKELLSSFAHIEKNEIDETLFFHAHN